MNAKINKHRTGIFRSSHGRLYYTVDIYHSDVEIVVQRGYNTIYVYIKSDKFSRIKKQYVINEPYKQLRAKISHDIVEHLLQITNENKK